MAKNRCPVGPSEFMELAESVIITINGVEATAEPKQFSTGSFGWYLNSKVNVKVGDKSVPVQIGMNLTVVGSKEAQDSPRKALPAADDDSADDDSAEA